MIWRIAVVGFVAILAGTLGSWVGDRDLPTIQVTAEIITPTGKQGDRVLVHEVVDRRKPCALQVERIMTDSRKVRYTLEDLVFSAPPGGVGRDEYVTPIPIPVSMELGPATVRVNKLYRCNPVHWLWPILSDRLEFNFEVVAGPEYQRVDPVPNTR